MRLISEDEGTRTSVLDRRPHVFKVYDELFRA